MVINNNNIATSQGFCENYNEKNHKYVPLQNPVLGLCFKPSNVFNLPQNKTKILTMASNILPDLAASSLLLPVSFLQTDGLPWFYLVMIFKINECS